MSETNRVPSGKEKTEEKEKKNRSTGGEEELHSISLELVERINSAIIGGESGADGRDAELREALRCVMMRKGAGESVDSASMAALIEGLKESFEDQQV